MRGVAWIGLVSTLVVCASAATMCAEGSTMKGDGRALLCVDMTKPGRPVSPALYGIFYEDVNHAGDSGIYAELVRNRSFEDAVPPAGCTVKDGVMLTPTGWETRFDDSDPLPGWKLAVDAPAKGAMAPDDSLPLNEHNLRSLRIDTDCSAGGRVSVANEGYWGIPVSKGGEYKLSFFARTDIPGGSSVTVSIRESDGTVLASREVRGIGPKWRRFRCALVGGGDSRSARLCISTTATGTLWLDTVSLFPKTWKNRPNGLRPDLAKMLAAMKPAFVRFPGGCFVEGCTPETAFQWKKTIGPIEEREGHWNLWGYRATDGLGYHEFLQMCEDLHAEPMYVFNCGMTCQARSAVVTPLDEMQPMIDDLMDAIEYANGPADSKWGAVRAAAGHPKPFGLKYLEIGNENSGPDYEARYKLFYDAIRSRYPDLVLIANAPVQSAPMEVLDEHYYADPAFFISQSDRYDGYDRTGPGIYVGEYAVVQNCGKGNLIAGVAEAAFMAGMESNGDIVKMSSYAPLFVNVNDRTWNPDAICFDNSSCYGTPSYHVQRIFAANRADEAFDCRVTQSPASLSAHADHGSIGLSTWATSAEFKDITVTKDGRTLYASDFGSDAAGWGLPSGEWSVVDGALRQTSMGCDTRITAGDPSWSDYTLSLKARKLGGAEGFLIMFNVRGSGDWTWLNLGGWANASHGVERCVGGMKSFVGDRVPGSIETGRWYDIRIEVSGPRIRCFLDGAQILDVRIPAPKAIVATVGRSKSTGEVILKVVNTSAQPQETEVTLDGAGSLSTVGREIVLTSADPMDENSFEGPLKVSPVTRKATGLGPHFVRAFPPYSVTILRLHEQRP